LKDKQTGGLIFVYQVCFVAALGGLLFGYDTAVISGAIGFLKSRFDLSAAAKGWAASCALIGCIIGVSIAGILSDRLGRKKTLIISAFLFLISALGTALPRTLTEFIIFRIIGGVGVGAASITSPMYIAEISPAGIRGRMVSINQFAIILGMLVVYFVNYYIAGQGDEKWNVQLGWRWMFGSESLPAAMLLFLMFLIPETPRWLVKQKFESKALDILTRVSGEKNAEKELASIKETIAYEKGSVLQLFEPGMIIVLVIGVTLAILQQITGINVFLYYAPEIFKKVGTETNAALLETVAVGAVNLTFTVVAIVTVDRIGRKPLMVAGAGGMGICLFAMGFASYYQAAGVWLLIFVLGYIASFALSLGPVVWVVLSEIFPTKVRGRAMGIATLCLWSANFLVSQSFPMLDENKWLVDKFHHGFTFWLYGAFCIVTIFFVLAFVPETKGKSLEEIEKFWLTNRSRTGALFSK